MPLIYFWPCWVLVAAGRLSLVVMIWGCSLVVMRGHVFAVPSLVRARRPNHPRHVGSSRTGDHTRVSCVGRWVLHYWVTREVLCLIFWGTARVCFQSGRTILHSHPQHMKVPVPLNLHQHSLIGCLFYYCHPSGCEVVSHCRSDLCFPDGWWY